jgi:hypothetical protein
MLRPAWLAQQVVQEPKAGTLEEVRTVVDYGKVLSEHAQHYEDSCAASGMELVLKLHSLVEPSFRGIQDKYGNTNIGFEKLRELELYGVWAQDKELPLAEAFAEIQSEVQRGHFPLLSVYDPSSGRWHIWAAIPHDHSFRLVSRAFGHNRPLEIDDLNEVRENLARHRLGKVHFIRYDVRSSKRGEKGTGSERGV